MTFSMAATIAAIVDRVLEIKSRDRIKGITILSPSFSVNRSINRALLLSGKPLLNVTVETVNLHVQRLTESMLTGSGIESWREDEARTALQRILEENDFDCFRPAVDFPSYSFYLGRVIRELRVGVPAVDLKPVLEPLGLKGQELYRIYAAYLEAKQEKADAADRCRCYQGTSETVLVFPGVMETLSVAEKTALAKNTDLLVGVYQTADEPVLTLRNPLHQTAEIRDTIRAILDLDTHLDRIVVIAPADYLPAVFREANRLQLPVYCPFGEELPQHTAELFKSVIAVIETDFAYPDLKRFLQLKGWFDELLAVINCGVAQGGDLLRRIVAEKMAAEPAPYLQKLQTVLDRFSEISALKAKPYELGPAIVDWVLPNSQAKHLVRALLEDLRTIAPKAGFDRWYRLVEERISRLRTGGVRREQAVYLTSDFLPGDFDHVFLLGLKEGAFPLRFREDPILLDHEREAINAATGGSLLTAAAKNQQQMDSLDLTRSCARKSWVGSYPAMDLISGDVIAPSYFLIDVIRAMNGGQTINQQVFTEALKKSRVDWLPKTPGQCLDTLDWTLHHLFNETNGFIDHLMATGESAWRHYQSHRAYWSDDFNAYSGLIDTDVLSAQTNDHCFSATQLEGFMTCPYRWFVERQLDVRPSEEPQAMDKATPMIIGSLLHEILETVLTHQPGTPPDPDFIQTTLKTAVQRKIATTGPIPTIFVEKLEKDLTDMTENFLKHEAEMIKDGRQARYFELSFGLPGRACCQDDPVALQIGTHHFKLRGSIDRVDIAGTKAYILDYKGSKPDRFKTVTFDGGRKLQPALYAEALALLPVTTQPFTEIQAGYLPLKGNATEYLHRHDAENRLRLEHIIDFIFQAMAKGWFFATGECDWCHYQPICGNGITVSMEKKMRKAQSGGPLQPLAKDLALIRGY